jgi:site-specific DNA-methyltransferase (adenine-specific)
VTSADLRLGRWQDVLADVECDALIVDAPYSERTHSGHSETAAGHAGAGGDGANRREISYGSWSAGDVCSFVAHWAPKTRGWFVSVTDHVLAPAWAAALEATGRLVFYPLPFVAPGSRVRLAGDGPSSWTCQIIVARPRSRAFAKWGTLPGAYVLPSGESGNAVMGGKPLWLMRALVRDYTRTGDLVCDPCAGGGTTLLAALMEHRRAVGSECLQEHYDIARKRLSRGYTPSFQFDAPASGVLKTGGDK